MPGLLYQCRRQLIGLARISHPCGIAPFSRRSISPALALTTANFTTRVRVWWVQPIKGACVGHFCLGRIIQRQSKAVTINKGRCATNGSARRQGALVAPQRLFRHVVDAHNPAAKPRRYRCRPRCPQLPRLIAFDISAVTKAWIGSIMTIAKSSMVSSSLHQFLCIGGQS